MAFFYLLTSLGFYYRLEPLAALLLLLLLHRERERERRRSMPAMPGEKRDSGFQVHLFRFRFISSPRVLHLFQ